MRFEMSARAERPRVAAAGPEAHLKIATGGVEGHLNRIRRPEKGLRRGVVRLLPQNT